jgi:protein-L-isoaspartate(D-aspartate) O-methyltransferase
MIEHQLLRRGLRDDRVLAAMGSIPRERFVPDEQRHRAYQDSALPIGHGQTISQPYIVARTCALAGLRGGETVLEVGAGSGYQAAVLARLCGHVVAIERIPELIEGAAGALAGLGLDNVDIVLGDGNQGYPPYAPYDRIIVSAGTPTLPTALLGQLANGGRMVIPMGPPERQTLRVIDKLPGGLVEREHDACVFVPLV